MSTNEDLNFGMATDPAYRRDKCTDEYVNWDSHECTNEIFIRAVVAFFDQFLNDQNPLSHSSQTCILVCLKFQ